jgi:hypothetical protein
VPDGGGAATVAVKPDPNRTGAGSAWPYFLPDGRRFLFIANDGKGSPVNVMVGAIDSDKVTVLDTAMSRIEYAAGHLFYVNQQTLMARPFSADTLAFTGEAFPVTDRIAIQGASLADFSTSQSGDLAYSTEAGERLSRLTWVDRSGNELGAVGEPALYRADIALAPDETRAAVAIGTNGAKSGTDDSIWTIDLKRGVASRLTFGSDLQSFPVWSPDSMSIAYSATGKGGPLTQVVQRLASGVGEEQPIADVKEGALLATDWSADGKVVLLSWAIGSNVGLRTVPADGHAAPSDLLKAPSSVREINGRFSPDNRWFAYQSNESGRFEVYVQSYPPSGGKWQISTAGGGVPMWRGDGKELFYLSLDGTFFAAPIKVIGAGLEIGLPMKLFKHRLAGRSNRNRNSWVATRDGQRFLLNAPNDDGTSRSIQVVLNWMAGLKKPN